MLACRPATLLVGVVPVLVGTAVARALGTVRLGPSLACLAGAVFLQIGSNLANDVFDYEKGADTTARLGPLRVTQAGLLSPRAMRWGMALVFGLALAVGVYLTKVAGVPIVLMGTASILSAIAYTGGPWPLGYHGLGDLFVFVFFGLVAVCGTVFVSTGGWSLLAVLAAVPVGALATGVLVVNNVRDHETDVHAGKRTLVVRFGRRFGVGEYVGLVAVAYAVPVLLVVGGWTGTAGLLPLLTVPLAVRLCVGVGRTRGASLNAYLGGTAKLLFAFGVLFAVGIGAVNK